MRRQAELCWGPPRPTQHPSLAPRAPPPRAPPFNPQSLNARGSGQGQQRRGAPTCLAPVTSEEGPPQHTDYHPTLHADVAACTCAHTHTEALVTVKQHFEHPQCAKALEPQAWAATPEHQSLSCRHPFPGSRPPPIKWGHQGIRDQSLLPVSDGGEHLL